MAREYSVQYTARRLGSLTTRTCQPGTREYAVRGVRDLREWQRTHRLPVDARVVIRDHPRDEWRPLPARRRRRR